MDAKTLAAQLNGIEYPCRDIRDLVKQARDAGLVIVFGLSDDLMEFRGAIDDELGADDGTTAYVDNQGLLPERNQIEDDDELPYYFARQHHAVAIHQLWCKEGDYSWTYQTTIPHETFEIVEDGGPYCRGIVFALADAKAAV